MPEHSTEQMLAEAIRLYGKLSSTHNAHMDVLHSEGKSKIDGVFASYLALRVMLAQIAPHIAAAIDFSSVDHLENLVTAMTQSVSVPSTQTKALA